MSSRIIKHKLKCIEYTHFVWLILFSTSQRQEKSPNHYTFDSMTSFVKSSDQSIQLAYKTMGSGDEVMLLFHGFGHVKEELEFVIYHLSTHFRVILIDLPGHGESEWNENLRSNRPISKQEWKEMIERITRNENVKRFHLVGYSLGGRMALVTAEVLSKRISSLTLFSPDGLYKSPWYRFGNDWAVGRKVLKFALKQAKNSVSIVNYAAKWKLLPKDKAKFVTYQLEDHRRLAMIFQVWNALRMCWPNLDKIFSNAPFHTTIVFGKKDPIILPRYGDRLKKFSQSSIRILIAPLGHRTLKSEGIDFLSNQGYWPPSSSEPVERV